MALLEGTVVVVSGVGPDLGRSIALALVRGGAQRMGERVFVFMRSRGTVPAIITNAVFFDPTSERQNA
jgi:sarcosine oxidase subunit alpha